MKLHPSYFLFLLSIIAFSKLHSQIQIGTDINGVASDDYFGSSISMPTATTIAVGAIFNDAAGIDAGHVRVFGWNGSNWTQKGQTLNGEAAGDRSGWSVSMPDDNTVAIGARSNDGTGSEAGHVRVFSWNGTNWIQKGIDINGEAATNYFGFSVSMPDANTIAIGGTLNNSTFFQAGHVRVFNWNGSAWIQKGIDIDGEASNDQSGYSVSMPDANTVAIGAINNDGNGSNAGHVRIYSWNGSAWVQKGIDIDGEASNDQFGYSVSMPDANTVGIGAIGNDGNGTNAGHVRIYSWNGSAWVQKGIDIDGEAVSDQSGFSISMPDANTVAIGANNNDGNGSNSGHVRVYKWNGSIWQQFGIDINGEASNDESGRSVSMPNNNTVAIGAIFNDGAASNAGHTRVYSLCNTTGTAVITACNSYTWINGITYTSSNNTAVHTLINAAGCDSIVTLNLTIINNTSANVNASACESYTWEINGQTYTNSGNYIATIPNAAGCDSIITLNLIINNPNSGIDNVTACNTYTWINGISYTSSNNTATYALTNAAGCDSIVTLNLTIINNTSANVTASACESYTWGINGQTYTNSGNYIATIPNAAGCDSIVMLDLTINSNTFSTVSETACESYSWITSGQTYTNSGVYIVTIPNTAGCDSIISLNLTINNSTSEVDLITACDNYTWIDGITYTSSNNSATFTLTNMNGCDSIISLDLTITNSPSINISADVNNVITATGGSIYQWINCTNETEIVGATGAIFNPTQNGSYAVISSNGSCPDTSDCVSITTVGIVDNTFGAGLEVYPNPTFGSVYINLGSVFDQPKVLVTDLYGKIVEVQTPSQAQVFNLSIEEPAGIYFMRIEAEDHKALIRLIKQ